MTGRKQSKSQAEAWTRKIAAALSKGQLPAMTADFESYLERQPEEIFNTLAVFAERILDQGDTDMLVHGSIQLLGMQLERIRYRSDRGFPEAVKITDAFQKALAELAADGDLDSVALSMLASALHHAGIPASEELREAMLHQGDIDGDDIDETEIGDFAAMFGQVADQCEGDPFTFVAMIAQTGHAMPVGMRAELAAIHAGADHPLMREAGVLALLDGEPAIRKAAATALLAHAAAISPVSLRRMIAIRNWRPEAERPAIDAAIRAARLKGVECAAWPATLEATIVTSCVDGSGAQGIMIVSPEGRRKCLSSVLLKNGVRDAWTAPPDTPKSVDGTIKMAIRETGVRPVSRAYCDRVVRHGLHVGIAAGETPQVGLLQVAEAIGAEAWQPEATDWRETLATLLAELPPGTLDPETVAALIRTSHVWSDFGPIVESWFEDDQEAVEMSDGPRKRRAKPTVAHVLASVIEPRRERWARQFAWTALWLREWPDAQTPGARWRKFAVLAHVLLDGHALTEIPLMGLIAGRTAMVLGEN